jgi:hypothetical protein
MQTVQIKLPDEEEDFPAIQLYLKSAKTSSGAWPVAVLYSSDLQRIPYFSFYADGENKERKF